MNNRLTLAALSAAALLALASCEEKEYKACPPTWKGFEMVMNGQKVSNRTTFHPGDSVKVIAVQDQKGRYINSTYYTWTLTCTVYDAPTSYRDTVITKQYHTNYDGISSVNPEHTFAIPQGAQGRATVNFNATYSYSADGVLEWDGSIQGGGTSYSGSITSTSSLLSGDAHGSVTINIK